ncbi:DNA methylase [Sphingopyxis macrogoltabida]|nr:DNA methylase [Sphingopyxis macrogoltabida]
MPKPNKSSTGSNRQSVQCPHEHVALSELSPAARRVRKHPAHKRRMVEASMAEYGILQPLAINAAGVIVDGHLRWEIAKQLGWHMVPVIRIEHLSEAELRAYALAANKLPAVANFDVEALRLELEEIRAEVPTLDIGLTGFSISEVDRIVGHHQAGLYDDLDEEPADDTAPPRAKPGDLYILGAHRLICGDSLDPAVIARLMDGGVAKAAFTDPPYNVKINGHVSGSGEHDEFAMASGEMSREQFAAFLSGAISNLTAILADGAIAFVCMDHAHVGELIEAGDACFDKRLNICVWDKGQGGMGSLYRSQHELVLVFKHGTAPHLNNVELGKNGRNRTNIWSFPGMAGVGKRRKKALELHPTVKPVALVAEALLDVTAPGDIVVDLFGGSGSTLIAAERIDRAARLVEYEPRYVDRTIARWERLTGRKAVLVDAEPEPEQPHVEATENGVDHVE